MSLRSYAARRGVSPEAVSKAIRDGRLVEAVVRVKRQPKIGNADVADREWDANTRPARSPGVEPRDESWISIEFVSFVEARRRKEIGLARQSDIKAQADLLDLQAKKGELVQVGVIRRKVQADYANVRAKLLGLATRCKQQLAKLTAADVARINVIVREALEDLADDDSSG